MAKQKGSANVNSIVNLLIKICKVTILLIIILTIVLKIYGIKVSSYKSNARMQTFENSKSFIQTCDSLNGKELTYENIARLNGFVLMNLSQTSRGLIKMKKEYFNDYIKEIKGERTKTNILNNNFPKQKSLRITKDELLKGPTMICAITPNDVGIIYSTSEYYLDLD